MKPKEDTLLYLLSTHFFTSTQASFYLYARALSASRGYYPLPLLLILYLLRLAIPLPYLLQERILGRKLCPFPYSTSSPNKAPPAGYPPGRKWATYTAIRVRKSQGT